MIPLTMAHQDLVALERAQLLARVERSRTQREQATKSNRNQSRAGRRAGTNPVRRKAGRMLIRVGRLVAGSDWVESAPARTASAIR